VAKAHHEPFPPVEMAEHMDLEHSGLQEVANAMREDAGAEGLLSNNAQKRKREGESADDTRRSSNKRISPNSAKHDQQDESLQDYGLHQENGATDHANNASSTAAAALAGIYPTMTIPQPTDVSFATQASDSNPDGSFMDNSQQESSFMDNSTPSGRGSGSKPAVGSDEWHKVRKDNHKEGMSILSSVT
jgi:hypothetical protein